MTPQTPQPANSPISLHDVPSSTTWKKVLCQPNIQADSTGRLLRRILSITNTEPPVTLYARTALPAATRPTLLELTQPLPTAYNIYVDGGWTTTQADFHTAFQEQRDPTNRQGSAGIAIVPTGPDWMQQGTILLTLNEGSQSGSHQRTWNSPRSSLDSPYDGGHSHPNKETLSTPTANPSRTPSKAQPLRYLNTQPSYHSSKQSCTTSKPSAPKALPLTGPNHIQNGGSSPSNIRPTTRASY